jgi:hypothetical protein
VVFAQRHSGRGVQRTLGRRPDKLLTLLTVEVDAAAHARRVIDSRTDVAGEGR